MNICTELVVLSAWQHKLRYVVEQAKKEQHEAMQQYEKELKTCTDQVKRDSLREARNKRLVAVRLKILDETTAAVMKAKTAEDLDILYAKEYIALNLFLSELFEDAEKTYRQILDARLKIRDVTERTALTRHMLLATLHNIAERDLCTPDRVRREALELAMPNVNCTIKENEKLSEDVDMALNWLSKLQKPGRDDDLKLAIVLRKKVELLERSTGHGKGKSSVNEQLIKAKMKLFNLLSQGLQENDEARSVAISLEPGLRKELGNPTLADPNIRRRIENFLVKMERFLADTAKPLPMGAPVGTPADEREPSFGISRVTTWRSDPLEEDEVEEAALFDATAKRPDENIKESEKWIRDFLRFRTKTLENAKVNISDPAQTRVRVVIIDTGIDPEHQYIKDRRWNPVPKPGATPVERYRDFSTVGPVENGHQAERPLKSRPPPPPSPSRPEDRDGHGTFIAGIFLQLVPDVDLRIARIGKTRDDIQKDVNLSFKVAQAINHAVDEWDSEIISMSFCCAETPALRTAARHAVSKDVLLFAATGNNGLNEDLVYPATEHRVFKVMASDYIGEKTAFSTPSENKDYSLLTLGCAIESTWPCTLRAAAAAEGLEIICPRAIIRKKLETENQHPRGSNCTCTDTWTVMSGTSFATPIAAAFAAVVYQFYNAHRSKIKLDNGKEGFKSITSMRRVLKAMTVQPGIKSYLRAPNHKANPFMFRPASRGAATNAQGKTYDEFFIDALVTVIDAGDGTFG